MLTPHQTTQKPSGDATSAPQNLSVSTPARHEKSVTHPSTDFNSRMCSIDLCFVLDCSSSMSRSIEKIQPQLQKLCKAMAFEVYNKRMGCEVRYSTVFFRDHDYRSKRLESVDFTSNIDDIIRSFCTIETIGGNDVPEDVLGGLNRALSLSWQGDLKFLIFIGDAPCHGVK
ncbi:hypothetical protein PROFUN_16631, partial [Planoprotostelium fungivorum]